ncbi:MAG: Nramp family divalent metal transporter [Phycisphaerae bacterium]
MAGNSKKNDSSLSEVHSSVVIPRGPGFWRRLMAFAGPAYLVSVGYMDPGNWATDLEGGARFGYQLIWVLLMSNLMAVLLQSLSVRLGLVAGRDLAQACREHYPRPVVYCLWVLGELAIAATDLAEVLGTAIGLNLLFGIPILMGVIITGFDVILLLVIQRFGIRRMEALIVSLVGLIGLAFVVELFLAKPVWGQVMTGFVPRLSKESLYVAIGIIGATVMPHNLYLHSALVQTRDVRRTFNSIRAALRFNLIDSIVALNGAFFINAAILILAGAVFYKRGLVVTTLGQAHELLAPLLGSTVAGIAFAVGLLAAGQSSTLTGTLAGQVVMEGFLQFKMRPWLRRLVTRLMAIIPAVITISIMKNAGSYKLLILSQVILSLQLPFAVVPLIWFTSSRRMMGEFVIKLWVKILAGMAAVIIIGLNAILVWNTVGEWFMAGGFIAWVTILPVLVFLIGLLLWLIIWPMVGKDRVREIYIHEPTSLDITLHPQKFERIGVALELSNADRPVLETAVLLAQGHGAALSLIHVVENIGGKVYGKEAFDLEARRDEAYVSSLTEKLKNDYALTVEPVMGYGNPIKELVRLVELYDLDLLIMGSHRHGILMDILLGQTVSSVRHAVKIPVLVVPRSWRME